MRPLGVALLLQHLDHNKGIRTGMGHEVLDDQHKKLLHPEGELNLEIAQMWVKISAWQPRTHLVELKSCEG